jgi:nitroreductase
MNDDATVAGTVMQALMSRRSIRAFLPDAVDETTLRQIFDHARRARSGWIPLRRPRSIAITGSSRKNRLRGSVAS